MTRRFNKKVFLAAAALGATFSHHSLAQGPVPDATLQADAQKQLRGKQFRNLQIQTTGAVVLLTGTVNVLADKLDAQKRVERTHEAVSVNNEITVSVPEGVSDADIFAKLSRKLTYDRQGYGTLPFNSLTLDVRNGIVTLGGEVVLPMDKDSAVGLVTNQPGVRGLIDHLQVAPVSPNDDRVRRAEFQAVYGAPQLNKYAINPAKPIRIVVLSGNVTLTGVVDNTGDREIAGIRANAVPGAFSVKNELQVAEQGSDR